MFCGYMREGYTCPDQATTTRNLPFRLDPPCGDFGVVHLCDVHAIAVDAWEFGRKQRGEL